MDRLLPLMIILIATGAFSAWWTARDGRIASTLTPDGGGSSRWSALPIEALDLATAVASTTRLTLVEFTAPDCQPCVATRTLLDEATTGRDDISIATLDVSESLDLARSHRIMRAPTTLLITDEGHLLGRVSGVPRREELTALLDSTRQPQPA